LDFAVRGQADWKSQDVNSLMEEEQGVAVAANEAFSEGGNTVNAL